MDGLINMVLMVYNRFSTNLQTTLANMSPEKWIRLVIIAGTCQRPPSRLLPLLPLRTGQKTTPQLSN